MEIDLRTIVLMLGVTHLIQVIVFYFQYKSKNSYKGVGWWLLWSIAEVFGFGIMLFRDNPDWLPLVIIIQNTMIIIGTVFLNFGINQFTGKSLNFKLLIPLSLVYLCGLLFFLLIIDNIQVRSILINITIAIISYMTAYSLFTVKNRGIIASSHFNASVLVIHGSIFAFRTIMIAQGTSVNDLFTPTLFNAIPFLDALIVSLLLTFGLIIMLHQRLSGEMMEAREELQESESRFRLLFENMAEGVVLHEMIYGNNGNAKDYRVLDVNQAFERITAITGPEARGALGSELYGSDDPPYLQKYQSVLLTNQPVSFETFFESMNKNFYVSVVPVKPGYFATIFMDITSNKINEAESKRLLEISERSREALLNILEDQLKVQESLHESNELLSMFIKYSPIFAFIKEVSPDVSRVLKASENYLEMVGISGSEMAGKTMYEIFPPDYASKFTTDDWEDASKGIILKLDEEMNGRAYETIKFPIIIGSRTFLAGYTIDITDRKIAAEEIKKLNETLELRIALRTSQLEASNSELEAFTYSVSHDLRAPLRHINGYVDLLVKQFHELLPAKGKHYLDSIKSSTQQMGTLIDDLLLFSRTGRQDLHMADIDMNTVLEEAMHSIEHDLNGREIDWILEKLPVVNGDFNLLRQVWINLLSNAVKFTRDRIHPRIEIGYSIDKKEYKFFIRDNGVGFDMKYAQKLFGVFQRFHATEDFEGTGIGLANVRRIIMKHGGRTWAEAEIDKGAAFYFSLLKNNSQNTMG